MSEESKDYRLADFYDDAFEELDEGAQQANFSLYSCTDHPEFVTSQKEDKCPIDGKILILAD